MGSVENILENKQKHLEVLIERLEKMMADCQIMGESHLGPEDYGKMTKDELAARRQNKHRANYFDALGRNLSLVLGYLPGDNKIFEAELQSLLENVRRSDEETGNIPENFIHEIDDLAQRIIAKAKPEKI
jgi:hypothetical protein